MSSVHHLDIRQQKKKGGTPGNLRLSGMDIRLVKARLTNTSGRALVGSGGCVWRTPDIGSACRIFTRLLGNMVTTAIICFISLVLLMFLRLQTHSISHSFKGKLLIFYSWSSSIILGNRLGFVWTQSSPLFSDPMTRTQIISGHSCRSVVVTDLLQNSRKVAEIILLKFLFHFMT